MDPSAITGLRDLRLRETPSHNDHEISSTQARTSVQKALITDNQDHGASSPTSDADYVPSSATLLPPWPTTSRHAAAQLYTQIPDLRPKSSSKHKRFQSVYRGREDEYDKRYYDEDYDRRGRSISRSRSRSRPRDHDSGRENVGKKNSSSVNTFLGAGGGALIGDMIFPGLGTLGGAVLGGVGGHEYRKSRDKPLSKRSTYQSYPRSSKRDNAKYRPPMPARSFAIPDAAVLPPRSSKDKASNSLLYGSEAEGAIMTLASEIAPQSVEHAESTMALASRPVVNDEQSTSLDHEAEETEVRKRQSMDSLTEQLEREPTSTWTEEGVEGSRCAYRAMALEETKESDAPSHITDRSASSPKSPPRKTMSLVPPHDPSDLIAERSGLEIVDLVPITTPRPSPAAAAVSVDVEDLEPRNNFQNETPYHTTVAQPDVSQSTFARETQPMDIVTLASGMVVGLKLTAECLNLPELNVPPSSTTLLSPAQDDVGKNPFKRRLEQLVEYLACERSSSSCGTSSVTDSDDASSRSEHSQSHSGSRHRNGASSSDDPNSAKGSGSHGQHASGSTDQTPCEQPSDRSRNTSSSGPVREHEESGRVRTDTRQVKNDQDTAKVIPCPLRLELNCAGMDENMSSLL